MSNKIALITGAGSGIGKAVSLALARSGYTVILTGRRADRLQAVAAEGGANCHAIPASVTDAAQVKELFAQIQSRFGRLDLLFNNAGTGAPSTPLEDLSIERWRAVIDTNVTGVFLCTQAAFSLMKSQTPQGG